MNTRTLHHTAIALVAAAGLALVPGAQAQQTGTTNPATGRPCDDNGSTIEDGDVITWRKPNGSKGSITCTDGTLCRTWKTRQRGTTWAWFSECSTGPGNRW
jgi:hypothetical protein